MTISKQFRLLPECRDQRATALHRAQIAARALAQIGEVAGAVVRHGVMLQVTPDVLDGVQFRRVGRQMLQGDAAVQAGRSGVGRCAGVEIKMVTRGECDRHGQPMQVLNE